MCQYTSWGLNINIDYIYKGNTYRYDDIGNIHYGYVGREVFGILVLLSGAGVYQAISDFKRGSGNLLSKASNIQFNHFYAFFDDPQDQQMVMIGSVLWDIDNGNI